MHTFSQLQLGDPSAGSGQALPAAPPSLRVLRETPQDRVLDAGHKAASNLELIATLIDDPDLALQVLAHFPTLRDLVNASAIELQAVTGIGPRRAALPKAAIELGHRTVTDRPEERPQIRSPGDAASILIPQMGHLEQEELRVMLLDSFTACSDEWFSAASEPSASCAMAGVRLYIKASVLRPHGSCTLDGPAPVHRPRS